MNSQSRSSDNGMTANQSHNKGVGGRHKQTNPPGGGGGYQDIYPESDALGEKKIFSINDRRLDELYLIGLPKLWLTVAEQIGFDSFMVMWQILDGSPSDLDDLNRAYIPKMSRWRRYQRNQFIAALSAEGLQPRDIQARVATDLCETITASHIMRIINKSKTNIKSAND